jgi:hypothetical protein
MSRAQISPLLLSCERHSFLFRLVTGMKITYEEESWWTHLIKQQVIQKELVVTFPYVGAMRLYSKFVYMQRSSYTNNLSPVVYVQLILRPQDQSPPSLNLAHKVELLLAVRSHGTPGSLVSSLSIVTNGSWLPGFVESLKVEAVETPVEQRAETVLVEVLSVVQSTLRSVVVGANSRGPAGLAVPDLRGLGAASSDLLNVGGGLVHVVKVDVTARVLVCVYPSRCA